MITNASNVIYGKCCGISYHNLYAILPISDNRMVVACNDPIVPNHSFLFAVQIVIKYFPGNE